MKRLFRGKVNKIDNPLASSIKKNHREHIILNQKEIGGITRVAEKNINYITLLRYIWDPGMNDFLGK